MEVRRLTADDAQALWRLRLEALETEPQAFRETADQHRQRTVESYAKQLDEESDQNFVFGAFDADRRLVGMSGFYRNQPEHGCIWGMYVAPPYRKSGVGAKLIHAIVDHVRTLTDVRSVHLTVAHSQRSARNLYLRCGFKLAEERPTSPCGGNLPEDQDSMVLELFQDR